MGIFGNLFDLNRDGKIDSLEKGVELSFLQMMIMDEDDEEDEEIEDTENDR